MSTIEKYIKLANLLDDSGHYDAAKTIDELLAKRGSQEHLAHARLQLISALKSLEYYESASDGGPHRFDLHNAFKAAQNAAESLIKAMRDRDQKLASLELEMEKEVEVTEDEDDDGEEKETKKKKITLSFD